MPLTGEAKRKWSREYYAKNRERILARQIKRNAENKDRYRFYAMKRYYEKAMFKRLEQGGIGDNPPIGECK